ncbi:MAG: hypothetical protein AB1646_01120 [Thermodesulfobacteriota bacterium]
MGERPQESHTPSADAPPGSGSAVSSVGIKAALLLVLAAAHVVLTFAAVIPGYLSIDEAVYHWLCVSFDRVGDLAIMNGYEEFPSPELSHPYFTIHDGRIFAPFPYLFPILAWPLYKMDGFRGLFLCNSLAFVGVVVLCFFTARRMFKDVDLALNSCLLLVLGSFAWEYSQSAWPHMVALLFVTAAFCCFTHSYWPTTGRAGRLWGMAAGLVAGFSSGIRTDTILTFPALVLPFLFARPWRPRDAVTVVAGAIPGLAVSAMCNYLKFGEFSPFSYGQYQPNADALASLRGLAIPALMGLVIAWVMTRTACADAVKRHGKWLLVLACAAGIVAVAANPAIVQLAASILANARTSLVDIRALDPGMVFPPMERTASGAVAHAGAFKTALLQSMPFLALLIVPIASILRRETDRTALIVLFVTPLTVAGYGAYSFLQFEAGGGLCLNLRYLLPCMPFFAMLCAYAVRELPRWWGTPVGPGGVAAVCVVTAGVFFLLTKGWMPNREGWEFPILTVPLLIAGLLAGFVLVAMGADLKSSAPFRIMGWTLAVASIVWSGMICNVYDYLYHRHWRSLNLVFSEKLLQVVPGHSIFVAGHGFFTTAARLVEKEGVRIAYPASDEYRDLERLLNHHLSTGRRAFAAFPREVWMQLGKETLSRYRTIPVVVSAQFYVAEIVPVDRSSGGP